MTTSCIGSDAVPRLFQSFDFDQLHRLLPLDNGMGHMFTHPAITSSNPLHPIGPTLQSLPSEIYQSIISHLSIQDLTNLRRTSQHSRAQISQTLEYKDIYKNIPTVLRSCLATKTASQITLKQLHTALTDPQCSLCSADFATHLSLFTGNRVCAFCIRNSSFLTPYKFSSLLRLHPRSCAHIKFALTTIPGYFNPRRPYQCPRMRLFLLSSLPDDKLLSIPENIRASMFGDPLAQTSLNKNAVSHSPFIHPEIESDISPSTYDRFDPRFPVFNTFDSDDPREREVLALRFLTSIPLPYLNPSTKFVESAGRCQQCILHMRYLEIKWEREQKNLISLGGTGVASDATREKINEARKRSCAFYLRTDLENHVKIEHDERARPLTPKELSFRAKLRMLVEETRALGRPDDDFESTPYRFRF